MPIRYDLIKELLEHSVPGNFTESIGGFFVTTSARAKADAYVDGLSKDEIKIRLATVKLAEKKHMATDKSPFDDDEKLIEMTMVEYLELPKDEGELREMLRLWLTESARLGSLIAGGAAASLAALFVVGGLRGTPKGDPDDRPGRGGGAAGASASSSRPDA